MGACASKFKHFKDEAPPAAEKVEEVTAAATPEKEVKLVELTVNKDAPPLLPTTTAEKTEEKTAATANDDEAKPRSLEAAAETTTAVTAEKTAVTANDDEAKPRSLGNLFKEIKGDKRSPEDNGKALSNIKQEKATEVDTDTLKPVEKKASHDFEPATKNPEIGALQTGNTEESKEVGTLEKVGIAKRIEKPEENKQDENYGSDEKCENLEAEINAEKNEERKCEEKSTDKQVVEDPKTESIVENKIDEKHVIDDKKFKTRESKNEEHKHISDAEEKKFLKMETE